MEIRVATSHDGDAIQRIYAPYVLDTNITFEYDVPSVAEMQRRIQKTLENYPYLVAIIDEQVVGYAYASKYQERQAYQWDCEMSVYVDPQYQKQGIAKRLYTAMIQILKVMNIQNIYACITHPNEKSERFHEKFGFQLIGVFTKSGYKFEKWHDMIWMEKAIGDYKQVNEVISFATLSSQQIESCIKE